MLTSDHSRPGNQFEIWTVNNLTDVCRNHCLIKANELFWAFLLKQMNKREITRAVFWRTLLTLLLDVFVAYTAMCAKVGKEILKLK